MSFNKALVVGVAVLSFSTASSLGQVRVFMAADGEQGTAPATGHTSVAADPGSSVRVMAWMEDTTGPGQNLEGYQLIMPMTAEPVDGAEGGVTYVDNDPGLGGGDSIFINTERDDWAFGNIIIALDPVYNETPAQDIFGVFYASIAGFVPDPGAKGGILYLAEFDLELTEDACGEFELGFNLAPAPPPLVALFSDGGSQYGVDEYQPLTIVVSAECAGGCQEPCTDKNACTIEDACDGDVCVGTPVDCSGAGDECNDASCNADGVDGNCDDLTPVADRTPCDGGAGVCVAGACKPLGCVDPCDDDDACTVDDACDNDVCIGTPVDCSGAGDQCNVASCSPKGAEGNCAEMTPVDDGTLCDGGNGECIAGTCTPLCTDPCDDGDACTTGDVCDGPTCAGSPVDCSGAGDECNTAGCDAGGADGNCDDLTPVADRTPCDDGAGVCIAGVCKTLGCVDPCDDGDACTLDDACADDVCLGVPVDCTGAGDECNVAFCDAAGADGNCDDLVPLMDGAPCTDGTCQAGVCTPDGGDADTRLFMARDGEQDDAPSSGATRIELEPGETVQIMAWLNDDSAPGDTLNAYQLIFTDTAEPQGGATGMLSYVNNNPGGGGGDTIFMDADREDWVFADQLAVLDPTYNESPEAGLFGIFYSTIPGLGTDPALVDGVQYLVEFDFTASADACGEFVLRYNLESPPLTALFDPFGAEFNVDLVQELVLEVVNCGMGCEDPCTDNDACTIDDACSGDVCVGTPVDCSSAGDECNVATCSAAGADGNCDDLTPVADGTACDGENGQCIAGECTPLCADPCDDADACTVDDACDGNTCVGVPVDCADAGNECNTASCNPAGAEGNCKDLTPVADRTPCDGGAGVCIAGVCKALGCVDPCDDEDACTVDDACDDDVCLGTPVDCSGVGDECNVASCNAGGAEGNCDDLTAVPDGTACDGGNGLCMAGVCEPAEIPEVRVFMAADGAQGDAPAVGNTMVAVDPGSSTLIMVWLEDTSGPGQELEGYQIIIPDFGSAVGGALGTVTYVDNNPGMGGGDSIFINTERDDWAFGNEIIALDPTYNETPAQNIFGVFYASLPGFTPDPGAKGGIFYLCEFEFAASEDACGDFALPFNIAPAAPPLAALFGPAGTEYGVDAWQSLTIAVNASCGGCEDPCDDGDACTVADACDGDACVGEPVDCSGSGNECNVASCNAGGVEGNCDVLTPVDDGTPCGGGTGECMAGVCEPTGGCQDPCDDKNACTVEDACDGDLCVGTPVDCSAEGDECNAASCNVGGAEGNCDDLTAVPDGTLCDGGNGQCMAGVCEPVEIPDARLFMARDGDQGDAPAVGPTRIKLKPGETVRVTAWIDDNSAPGAILNAYQLIFPWFPMPQPGATGSMTYVDNEPGLGGGDSIVIDTTREDWVFEDQLAILDRTYNETIDTIYGVFYSTIPGLGTDPALVDGPQYLVEFEVAASADACGEFLLPFNLKQPPLTALFLPSGAEFAIDAFQPLILEVNCGCVDPCDDGDACTVDDACDGAVCVGDPVDCTDAGNECNTASCSAGGPEGNCDELIPVDDGTPCAGGDGVCVQGVCEPVGDCPAGPIMFIDPPAGVVDARIPNPRDSLTPLLGISMFIVDGPENAPAGCWSLCECDNPDPNEIIDVDEFEPGSYKITLARAITTGCVTVISYDDDQFGEFISHPANVNADGVSNQLDILALIDILNGVAEPPFGLYSADIAHRGIITPLDIIFLIDLLNGAEVFDPWMNVPLPENVGCPGGACGDPVECDDDNPCTDDVCDPVKGCMNIPNEDSCDDGDPCTRGDVCVGGACMGGPKLDCDDGNACTDDVCDPVDGCVYFDNDGPCDDGDRCTINDVCVDGQCMAGEDKPCLDADPCTIDSCEDGECVNESIEEGMFECIDGSKGDEFCRSLGAPAASCLDGICMCEGGSHPNPPDSLCLELRGAGTGNAIGTCMGDDSECNNPEPDGTYHCVDDDLNPFNGGICVDQACYANTGQIVVDIEVGPTAQPACGAQLFIGWDTATLDLAGSIIDPDGETGWTQIIGENVDQAAGTFDLVVSLPIGMSCDATTGIQSGGTIVRLIYNAIADCKSPGVFFRTHNPPTGVSGPNGSIEIIGCNGDLDPSPTPPIQINGSASMFTCPASTFGDADCNEITREVLYDPIEVLDPCNESVVITDVCEVTYFAACQSDLDCGRGDLCANDEQCSTTCIADPDVEGFMCDGLPCVGYCTVDDCTKGLCGMPVDPVGIDLGDYLDGGGDFLPGKTVVDCAYTNECGIPSECYFEVGNSGLNTLVIDLEMSPSMERGDPGNPIQRCIDFELSICDSTDSFGIELNQNVMIGAPNNLAGHGQAVFSVDPNNWTCLTAQDRKHSLTSTCEVVCGEDNAWHATFKGAPATNPLCHWLVQGNLDGNQVIDIFDYTQLAGMYLASPGPSSLCGLPEKHGDFTGDGLVTLADFTFVVANLFVQSKDPCDVLCDPAPSVPIVARASVRIDELDGDLVDDGRAADVTGDGVIDIADVEAFVRLNATDDPDAAERLLDMLGKIQRRTPVRTR